MSYRKTFCIVFSLCGFFALSKVSAADLTVDMYATKNKQKIGVIKFVDSKYGLKIYPELKDLEPGLHGFHVHAVPNCGNHGDNAKGHLDPENTNSHNGPYSDKGHLGDLPVLYFNESKKANGELLAPRLTVKDLKNHSIMIHAGGDNYSNTPKLGGGGAREACGVVKDVLQ